MTQPTEMIPNSMFLKDIRCPKCGSLAPFQFGPLPVTITAYDNDLDVHEVQWNSEDDIRCCKCGHNGVVGDFRGELTAGEIMQLEGKEGTGRTTGTNFPHDYNMRTTGGNEAVAMLVHCALEAIEQGRRSTEVCSLLQRTIELIHGQHPEVTSVTVRDYIFNALAPAYRQRYKVRMPYDMLQLPLCSSCGFPQCQHYNRGECP